MFRDGQHRREHRVILVVVLVHAVAADDLKVREAVQIRPRRRRSALCVAFVVDRIGLRHPDHRAVDDDLGASPGRSRPAPRVAERDQIGVGHRPQAVALEAEVLQPEAGLPGSGTMSGLQFLKFWMRPTFTRASWM